MKKRFGLPILIAGVITIGASLQGIAEQDAVQRGIKFFDTDPTAHNTYDDGQCTYYVFDKVKKDGKEIGNSWRDAKHWAKHAERAGYTVNDKPKQGAILQSPRGEVGHVAYIEHIDEHGALHVSEMNYEQPYKVTSRVIPVERIHRYAYIHPKEQTT